MTAGVILSWYAFRKVAKVGLWCCRYINRIAVLERNEFKNDAVIFFNVL